MSGFSEGLPEDFDKPTQLPTNTDQAAAWQNANKTWWESHPMRYDWKESVGGDEFSRHFFEEIDKRFLATSREFLPFKKVPFDPLVDFDALKTKDVLEIGVGNGSHASLLSQHAKSFTGIDLTDYAVRSTSSRFKIFGLNGNIQQMDAEKMAFPDGSFDFVWSWGVIHHSSNTRKVLEEIHRVLRPGGSATIMVYNRSFLQYWVMSFLLNGVARGQLFKTKSISKVLQQNNDGALARFYRASEWRNLVSDIFTIDWIRMCGNKPEVLPIPGGKVKTALLNATPNAAARFVLSTCRQGMFLCSHLTKK